MLLTVVQGYVSEKNRYMNGFVHSRVKNYIENGIEAEVFVLANRNKPDYDIEGVHVKTGNVSKLLEYIQNNNIKAICFHFLNVKMVAAIKDINKNLPVIIFVHGNEALYWYQRIFPDRLSSFVRILKFFKYILINTYSMNTIKRFFSKTDKDIHIVCVSEWMKKITTQNWKLYDKNIPIYIIPNIINEKTFNYVEKTGDLRYNVLMIRNFTSGKYALDIAMDTIIKLSERCPEFKKMQFTIYGDGWLYDKYTSRVKKFHNVKLNRRLLSQSEISKIHKSNGIFLCPTRQDAQGVSMCEAMSSGLVPITLSNTAIPEFLPPQYNLALHNADEMAARIMDLIKNEKEFLKLSRQVSEYVHNKCSIEKTTIKEINLIKKLTKES